jgi:hypothetical protein
MSWFSRFQQAAASKIGCHRRRAPIHMTGAKDVAAPPAQEGGAEAE